MDAYHQKYASLPNEEIQNRLNEKKEELISILNQIKFHTDNEIIRIAVMGCGDKRFIKGHKQIFEEVLQKAVEITTFDITTSHLQGENRVVEHDCILPLPNSPYAITYAHVLLKFINTERQWNVIKNSYDVLGTTGLAIHILDKEDYQTEEEKMSGGYFTVPINRWIEKLDTTGIKHQEIPVKYGLALVLLK